MKANLKALALICFILPILTVLISYIFSIKLDLVAACIPNFEGCTSISRVGRYPPIKYFFKPAMYIYAAILFFYWFHLLKCLENFKINKKYISWIALLSILFLILYLIFLGESKIYSFFRRIGIYVYILLMVLTQYLVSKELYIHYDKLKSIFTYNYVRIIYLLSNFLIILGILLLPMLIIKINSFPQIKNIISWNYFFLIQLYFLLSYLSFKKN